MAINQQYFYDDKNRSRSQCRRLRKAPVNANLSAEDKIRFLRDLLRIRRFEQTALKFYNQGKMGGFLHLYIGQESIAVGTVSLMGDDDHIITAYRDHGHALAAGMNMNECMAELYGKATGCSKGKGGSMHFFAPDKNYWGVTALWEVRLLSDSASPTESSIKDSKGLLCVSWETARSIRDAFTNVSTWHHCSSCRSSMSSKTTNIR